MTCEECQRLAIDLARSLPPFDIGGAVQRGDVLSHVAACGRCAQWLSVQETLSVALRATAAADGSLGAPAEVEANVMAAFRARQAQRASVSARPLPLVAWHADADAGTPRAARTWTPPASSSFRGPGGRTAALAAAAIVIIAALTMASLRWSTPALVEDHGAANATPTATTPSAAAPAPRGESASVPGTNAAVLEVLPDKGPKTTKGPPAPPRAAAVRTASRDAGGARAIRASHVAGASRGTDEFSGPAFVLLPYVEPLRPTEMRHIMRVRMTRAQLGAGEPRASGVEDSTVLADVLVGEDGTARAVRIVQ